MERIAVIGAGSWGTTVASIAARRATTMLWARRDELARAINRTHTNPDYLPDHELPDQVTASHELEEVVDRAELIVMAVPSHGFRSIFTETAQNLSPNTPIVSLTKGIEQETLATMTEVVHEVDESISRDVVGVVTGPNLASEIVAGQPTASVAAFRDTETARAVQGLLMGPTFRVYTHDDVIGCELGGALKNVMAIAAGMSDGLGFGDNTRATLLTRALAEVTRLGVAQGGRPETFAGLAGMGDLIATCSSDRSRNHRVGYALARGQTLEEVINEMKMVAEGVKTTKSALGLAERAGVDMPIATHVDLVLEGEMTPREAMSSLMTREAKAESL
ncbi:MAG TPA: NAD(P)H-dependent glycerol-3-phosphate dehydrogenase [Acidimicrobiia bacterium]|nr:NAD(P)H-dependent glycerol-3-phosphate dehydrogenase [Acidimicrobiia bacterium]